MQHEDNEQDADFCKKVHNTLNGISEKPTNKGATPGAPAPAGANQNQQMDAFFQNLMSMQAAGAQMKPEDMSPPLQQILTQDKLLELIKDDPEV